MVIPSQTRTHTARNLVIFTFLILTLPWLGRWLDSMMGSAPGEGIGTLIWIISPLGVSFLLRAFAGDGWADLGIRPMAGRSMASPSWLVRNTVWFTVGEA